MKTNSKITPAFCIALLLLSNMASAQQNETVRVGVLKFGTVNWVLNVIKEHQLDRKYGMDLKVVPLGSKNATHVAIQGGAADMIVSDWIWVTRQRAENRDYTFVSYSNAVGQLMVSPASGIQNLADLEGKKIGVAGGSVDKTWLLVSAYVQKKLGKDLSELIQPSFAAPPLLNQLALRGDLDGALNFWHYSARLQAAGFKSLLGLPEVLAELGIHRPIPVIGWVFSEQWAAQHSEAAEGFLRAVQDAQKLLAESDAEWLRLRPEMKAENDAIFNTLKQAFREGIPECFGDQDIQAARSTFEILARLGGKQLVGQSTQLQAGTFWKGYQGNRCNKAGNNNAVDRSVTANWQQHRVTTD